ncbi:MAG TPA: hypothetical protein DDW22_05335 [Prevotellaceae bacterium]|nr:hypothetical protein [Prevotellaceae bacterium]
MKKTITLILLFAFVAIAQAQTKRTVHIWKAGHETAVENVDSITFSEEVELPSDTSYVDLGLSVKWATCNVGASKPEEGGNFYAWGETATKDYYGWSSYKFYVSRSTFSKYSDEDGKTILSSDDDVATAVLGKAWRMPTYDELKELVNSCTWTWTTLNGVNGYQVKSDVNGNSIFLPAAGDYDEEKIEDVGMLGGYWGKTKPSASSEADYIFFSARTHSVSTDYRYAGWSVRPVLNVE